MKAYDILVHYENGSAFSANRIGENIKDVADKIIDEHKERKTISRIVIKWEDEK